MFNVTYINVCCKLSIAVDIRYYIRYSIAGHTPLYLTACGIGNHVKAVKFVILIGPSEAPNQIANHLTALDFLQLSYEQRSNMFKSVLKCFSFYSIIDSALVQNSADDFSPRCIGVCLFFQYCVNMMLRLLSNCPLRHCSVGR